MKTPDLAGFDIGLEVMAGESRRHSSWRMTRQIVSRAGRLCYGARIARVSHWFSWLLPTAISPPCSPAAMDDSERERAWKPGASTEQWPRAGAFPSSAACVVRAYLRRRHVGSLQQCSTAAQPKGVRVPCVHTYSLQDASSWPCRRDTVDVRCRTHARATKMSSWSRERFSVADH